MAGGFGRRPFGQGQHGNRELIPDPAPTQYIDMTGRGELSVVYPGRGSRWTARVTDDDGTVLGRLPVGRLSGISEGRNRSKSCSYSGHPLGAGAQLIAGAQFRNLQILRGDQLWFFGPFMDDAANIGGYTAQARGAKWNLDRRYVGPAGRTDLLTDGDFSQAIHMSPSSTPGRWNASRTSGFSLIAAGGQLTKARTPRRPNTVFSVKGVATDGDPDDQLRLTQNVTVSGGDFGVNVEFVGWYYIPTSGGLIDPAHKDRGVFLTTTKPLSQWDDPWPVGAFTENIEYAQSRVTLDHPRDTWERHDASVFVPPGTVRIVWCSLNFAPGTSYWADCHLYTDQAENFLDTDVYDVVDGLIEHAQDETLTPPKSDVNLSATGSAIGENITRRYFHAEHANVGGAIDELAGEGFFDWEETATPTSRYIRVASTWEGAPGLGSYKPALRVFVRSDGASNVSAMSLDRPGGSASSSVTAMGIGARVTREEAAAWDLDAFDGLTLEEVFVASETADGPALTLLANEHLAVVKDPHVLSFTTLPGSAHVTDLFIGDTIDAFADWGALQVDAVYEVVAKKTDPNTDTAAFIVNLERS